MIMIGVKKDLFAERFEETASKFDSALCVGLDPDVKLLHSGKQVAEFNRMVVEATAGIAAAYKPNLALYESIRDDGLDTFSGLVALEETVKYIRDASPDALIIADAKRGDIGPCANAYGERFCVQYDFDAVTAHPYMGFDSIEPFLRYRNIGVFVLCRTSNHSAQDFQDLIVIDPTSGEQKPQYQYVAETAQRWNEDGNVGLVVGATYPDEIRRVRDVCENMFFLIPGVGYQGGDLQAAVSAAADVNGLGFTISSSRQIMYAAKDSNGELKCNMKSANRVRAVAMRLRDEINSAIPGY